MILRPILKMILRLHNEKSGITDEFVMEPCGEYPMVQVQAGQWHSLEVQEEGTVVFEAKDGKYEPVSDKDMMRYPGNEVTHTVPTKNAINKRITNYESTLKSQKSHTAQ